MSLRLPALTILATLCMSVPALAATTANEAAILKIEQDMTASQTTASVTKTWDKNVVLEDMLAGMTGDPKLAEYVGLGAVHKDFDPQFASVSGINTTILRIKIEADSHLAFAYSVQHLKAKGKGGAPDLDFVFRETDCFHKKGGKWLLIHQQLSVPFDPKTGKAIFDSK